MNALNGPAAGVHAQPWPNVDVPSSRGAEDYASLAAELLGRSPAAIWLGDETQVSATLSHGNGNGNGNGNGKSNGTATSHRDETPAAPTAQS